MRLFTAFIAFLTAGLTAGAQLPAERITVDLSQDGYAPPIQAFGANQKIWEVHVKNSGKPVDLTINVPYMWFAQSAGAQGTISGICTVVGSPTSGIFDATFTSTNIPNVDATYVYGVGVANNGKLTMGQNSFSVSRDPYAGGSVNLNTTNAVNWGSINWVALPYPWPGDALESDLVAETNRARTAEGLLSIAIVGETNRARTAEDVLSNAIIAIGVITTNGQATALMALTTATNAQALANAALADFVVATNLTHIETIRATGAEGVLSNALVAIGVIATNGLAIANTALVDATNAIALVGIETVRAEGAEGAIGATASNALARNSVGYATNSGYANTSGTSVYANVSGYAAVSSYATNSGYASVAGYATNAGYGAWANNASNSIYATTANVASNLTTALSNKFALSGANVGYATNSGYAAVAGVATNALELGGMLAAAYLKTNENIDLVVPTVTTNLLVSGSLTPDATGTFTDRHVVYDGLATYASLDGAWAIWSTNNGSTIWILSGYADIGNINAQQWPELNGTVVGIYYGHNGYLVSGDATVTWVVTTNYDTLHIGVSNGVLSIVADGTNVWANLVNNIPAYASWANNASNAMYASVAAFASNGNYATYSKFASNVTAGVTNAFDARYLGIGSNAVSATYATTANNASNVAAGVTNKFDARYLGIGSNAVSATYASVAALASNSSYASVANVTSNVTAGVTNRFDSRYLGIGSNAVSASYTPVAGVASNMTTVQSNAFYPSGSTVVAATNANKLNGLAASVYVTQDESNVSLGTNVLVSGILGVPIMVSNATLYAWEPTTITTNLVYPTTNLLVSGSLTPDATGLYTNGAPSSGYPGWYQAGGNNIRSPPGGPYVVGAINFGFTNVVYGTVPTGTYVPAYTCTGTATVVYSYPVTNFSLITNFTWHAW